MKKLLFTMIAGLFITISANAQADRQQRQFSPDEKVKRQTEQMVADLGLNEEQTPKVEAINKKFNDKVQQLFQGEDIDRSKAREKMDTLRNERNEELKTVLSDGQYNKLIELEEKRMQERRQKQTERRGKQIPSKRGVPRGSAN